MPGLQDKNLIVTQKGNIHQLVLSEPAGVYRWEGPVENRDGRSKLPWTKGNSTAAVRTMRIRAPRKGVFSPDQIGQLIDAAKGDWKGLILTGYYTGGRFGDMETGRVSISAIAQSRSHKRKRRTRFAPSRSSLAQKSFTKCGSTELRPQSVGIHQTGLVFSPYLLRIRWAFVIGKDTH